MVTAAQQQDGDRPKPRHVLLHKPRGVLTAKKRLASNPSLPTVTELLVAGGLPAAAEASPVGRLDVESEGLLLLTDDGWLNHCMTHPSHACRKVYLAVARGGGRPGYRRRLRSGWCERLVSEGVIIRPSDASPYRAQPAAMTVMTYVEADAALGGGLGRCLNELLTVAGEGESKGESEGVVGEGGEGCEGAVGGEERDGVTGVGGGRECEGVGAAEVAAAAAELDFVCVTMTEGKKHEVRHLLRHGGFATLRLVRTAHGPISDPALLAQPPGSFRHLTPAEVEQLGQLGGMSEDMRADVRRRADPRADRADRADHASPSAATSAAGAARPGTALAVVPRGFGALYARVLHAGAPPPPLRLPCGRLCEGGVIEGVGHGGEAGVDLVVVGEPSVLEGAASYAASTCGGVPLIGMMALVAISERDLGAVTHATHHSEEWTGALNLVRAWRGPLPAQGVFFRGTALRDTSGIGDAPRSNDIAAAAAAGAYRRHGWTADMRYFDIEVCALWLPSSVLVALPLTPGWIASGKTFFPLETIPTETTKTRAGGGGGAHDEQRLRSSASYGLLLAAAIQPRELVLDPMAGSGAIPAEAASRFDAGFALCGDMTRSAAYKCGRVARACARGRVAACRWDVATLPLRMGCIDVIVTDFPWGKRSKAGPALLLDALAEFGRVLATGGRAVVLLTRAAAGRVLHGKPACLRLESTLHVVVAAAPMAVITLRKVAVADADADADDRRGDHGDGSSFGALSSGVCCAVRVDAALSCLPLSELLLRVWPRHVTSQSAAKRVVRHGRVCVASEPTSQIFWRSCVPLGERIVLRPLSAQRMQTVADAVAFASSLRDELTLLWEDAQWLCLVKPAGLPALHGRRSLANAVRGMQLAREQAAEETWTVAYDGEWRVGGAWLVTKGVVGALSLLDGDQVAALRWRCILKGRHTTASLAPLATAPVALQPDVLRVQESVRYGAVTEVAFSLPATTIDTWRLTAAEIGIEIVGGTGRRPRTVQDGPRAACIWVSSVHVGDAGRTGSASSVPPPPRFDKLFEMEALCVHRLAEEQRARERTASLAAGGAGGGELAPVAGMLSADRAAELVRDLLLEELIEEGEGEAGGEADGEEESDGGSDGGSDDQAACE
mmetsp:Transcript_16776/g.45492  ORF Transcript_16776/g.45492 Transcript_16776/m.45492 type:complete len:1127 (-) Transcript_16776:260-3640(-)